MGTIRASGLTIALVAAAVAAAGCGSDGETASAGLSSGTAEELAAMSDGVADALEAGDACDAARQADELRAAVSEAKLPPELRSEAQAAADQLVNVANCESTEEVTSTEEQDDEKQKEDEDEGEESGSEGEEGEGGEDSSEPPGHGGTPPGQVGKIKGGI